MVEREKDTMEEKMVIDRSTNGNNFAENSHMYRLGVGVVLCNKDRKVLVAKRGENDHGTGSAGAWQMPQGGVESSDKDVYATVARELKEELGVEEKQLKLVDRIEELIYYDLPEVYQKNSCKGYIGQKQYWFLYEFQGGDDDIDLAKATDDEFCDYEWVNFDEVIKRVLYFKKDVYVKVFEAFRSYFENGAKTSK